MVISELEDTEGHWGVLGSTGEHRTTRRKNSSTKAKAGSSPHQAGHQTSAEDSHRPSTWAFVEPQRPATSESAVLASSRPHFHGFVDLDSTDVLDVLGQH